MKFNLTVKKRLDNGNLEEVSVVGHNVDPAMISAADLAKVIEVEQWCERVLGVRVHITQVQ